MDLGFGNLWIGNSDGFPRIFLALMCWKFSVPRIPFSLGWGEIRPTIIQFLRIMAKELKFRHCVTIHGIPILIPRTSTEP